MRRKRLGKKITLIILSILFVGALLFLIRSEALFIKEVEVKLDKISCASIQDIKDKSQILDNFFFLLDSVELEKKLKANYPCIKSVSVSKYFPRKVKFEISAREPYLMIVTLKKEASSSAILQAIIESSSSPSSQPVSDNWALVDNEGVIFSQTKEKLDLPKIYFWSDNKVDASSHVLLKNVVETISFVKKLGISANQSQILSNALVIDSSTKIIFNLEKPIKPQIASLQLILEQAKIEEKEMSLVDLRFEKPVVRYTPKKGETKL